MFDSHPSDDPNSNIEHLARSFMHKCSFSTPDTVNRSSNVWAQFRGTPNEDRFAISEEWRLSGHYWQFIAVFDGHGGSTTAQYLAKHFTSHLRRSMELSFSYTPESAPSPIPPSPSTLQMPSATTGDRNDLSPSPFILFTEKNISEFLRRQVRAFDEDLGQAVKDICPHPELLSDKEAFELYKNHREVIARARCGSTMAGILLDKTEMRMWVCCVGDSSVVLSTKSANSEKRKAVLLNRHHTPHTPQEYHRVSMAHPSQERNNIWLDGQERIFGTLSMTRAFGDFMYKFPTSFTTMLFSKFPSTAMGSVDRVLSYNRTPPYVIPDPSVTFVDLTTFNEDEDPAVVIYTDGLEALADKLVMTTMAKSVSDDGSGASFFNLEVPPTAVDIIGGFLGQPANLAGLPPNLIDLFPNDNAAFDLIYNLICRAIPGKLRAHLAVKNDDSIDDEDFYIDDVTVIVWRPLASEQ
ncbi:phosphatase 2C-like domain-containing protein [Lentinula raphanica]|nr:phosphatase 2C-like domain-containing protein [Lentinula raphanica]